MEEEEEKEEEEEEEVLAPSLRIPSPNLSVSAEVEEVVEEEESLFKADGGG